jgi:hypothetical protein
MERVSTHTIGTRGQTQSITSFTKQAFPVTEKKPVEKERIDEIIIENYNLELKWVK